MREVSKWFFTQIASHRSRHAACSNEVELQVKIIYLFFININIVCECVKILQVVVERNVWPKLLLKAYLPLFCCVGHRRNG